MIGTQNWQESSGSYHGSKFLWELGIYLKKHMGGTKKRSISCLHIYWFSWLQAGADNLCWVGCSVTLFPCTVAVNLVHDLPPQKSCGKSPWTSRLPTLHWNYTSGILTGILPAIVSLYILLHWVTLYVHRYVKDHMMPKSLQLLQWLFCNRNNSLAKFPPPFLS